MQSVIHVQDRQFDFATLQPYNHTTLKTKPSNSMSTIRTCTPTEEQDGKQALERQSQCVACQMVKLDATLADRPRFGPLFAQCSQCHGTVCIQHVTSQGWCLQCTPRCANCGTAKIGPSPQTCKTCSKPMCQAPQCSFTCATCQTFQCAQHEVYCIDCESWSERSKTQPRVLVMPRRREHRDLPSLLQTTQRDRITTTGSDDRKL